jgi:hypothetical protein
MFKAVDAIVFWPRDLADDGRLARRLTQRAVG